MGAHQHSCFDGASTFSKETSAYFAFPATKDAKTRNFNGSRQQLVLRGFFGESRKLDIRNRLKPDCSGNDNKNAGVHHGMYVHKREKPLSSPFVLVVTNREVYLGRPLACMGCPCLRYQQQGACAVNMLPMHVCDAPSPCVSRTVLCVSAWAPEEYATVSASVS